MVATKTVLLSALVAVLGFLAFRELQIVTVSFSFMPLYIPAKRSDVFRMLMDDPEFWVKVHPLCTGVSNIVRSQDEDGQRMIQFDIQGSFFLFGFYQSDNFTFPVTMTVIEEDVATELIAQQLYGMIKIHQGFDLADAKEGKDGTLLTDSADYTAPYIIARYVLWQAEAAHAAITQNIRQHFMEIAEKVEPLT